MKVGHRINTFNISECSQNFTVFLFIFLFTTFLLSWWTTQSNCVKQKKTGRKFLRMDIVRFARHSNDGITEAYSEPCHSVLRK